MRVMLSLLPFWAPLTPPLGLGILKSHLNRAGIDAVLVDFNADEQLWRILTRYQAALKAHINPLHHGNIFEFGYDVLRNHVMAHVHGAADRRYPDLVRVLIETTFGTSAPKKLADDLSDMMEEFVGQVESKVLNAVREHAPDVFGVSTYTTSLGATLAALRAVRQSFPEIRTVLGGGIFADHIAPGSENFGTFLQVTRPYLDHIIVGEGEILLEQVLLGKLPFKRVYDRTDIRGEKIDTSAILPPNFEDLEVPSYSQMSTHIGRSCPFQCSFCSETVQWGQYRSKPIARWLDELESTTSRYGGRAFFLAESLINPVADEAFQATHQAGLNLYFDAYLRADPEACDPRRVENWRRGGFYRARLGIESGSTAVLDAMNKQTGPDQIKSAIRTLAGQGIKTTTYFVVGHPGETEADFQATLDLIDACAEDVYEAEPHGFYFYPRGQVASKRWAKNGDVQDLYGEEFADLLITRTFYLKSAPSRRVMLDRVARFTSFVRERGIFNPYSLADIAAADDRWAASHPGAGPSLVELHNVNHPPRPATSSRPATERPIHWRKSQSGRPTPV